MEFAGLHPDAVEFYRELAAHNDKAWWTANKARYDERVRAPFAQLADALGSEFGPVKIFRPYRDVRFSADKSPYKDHLGMVTQGSGGAVHYLQLGPDGLLVAGGVYDATPAQLARFRAIVDDVRLFGDLEATLEELADLGYDVIETDALATAPRGFRIDHPRIRLLRLKRLAVQHPLGVEEWMWTPAARDRIRQAWREVSIWCDWVAENVVAEPATT
jgi:uncharacterized protein (TIGR02453 family)